MIYIKNYERIYNRLLDLKYSNIKMSGCAIKFQQQPPFSFTFSLVDNFDRLSLVAYFVNKSASFCTNLFYSSSRIHSPTFVNISYNFIDHLVLKHLYFPYNWSTSTRLLFGWHMFWLDHKRLAPILWDRTYFQQEPELFISLLLLTHLLRPMNFKLIHPTLKNLEWLFVGYIVYNKGDLSI